MTTLYNNILTSNHEFTEEEDLQKFRFVLLASINLFTILIIISNYLASNYNLIYMHPISEITSLFYAFTLFISMIILRQKKKYYLISANILIISSLYSHFSSLLLDTHNEYRLIWFFLIVFTGFVTIGKKYGLYLTLLIVISVLSLVLNIKLGISTIALFTFLHALIIFTIFTYYFLNKIEKDSSKLQVLNKRLTLKVSKVLKKRKEQEAFLLKQYRMASLGTMIDSIAHQWRQPLTHINAVLMNISYASKCIPLDIKYVESKILEASDITLYMSQTIEDFRDLLQTDTEKTKFKLHSLLKHILKLHKNNLTNINITITGDLDTIVYTQSNELTQVIMILLSNAIDALNEKNIQYKSIIINTKSIHNIIHLNIIDNAGGINSDSIDKLFDPYFTTKRKAGGSGLGLYIAKLIMENRNLGELHVENIPQGAKFTIIIKDTK